MDWHRRNSEVAHMQILLIVGGLSALIILALRYGYDSRDGLRSEEQTLATFGFTWDRSPRVAHYPARREPAHGLRHRLAIELNTLADWLYPIRPPEELEQARQRA